MRLALTLLFALAVLAAGCRHADEAKARASPVARPLRLVEAATPPFRVPRFRTSGMYAEVAGARNLQAVNAALRAAVLADQRAYAPYARRERPKVAHYPEPGVYRTSVDRRLASASTVVVSVLMPATREIFPGQPGGDHWLGVTVEVPSGRRVRIVDLFADRRRGLGVLARAWKRRVQPPCPRAYASAFTPTSEHYGQFALTPRGLAVGSREVGACYRLVATVPYSVLRPHLNELGLRLVAGVRRPR